MKRLSSFFVAALILLAACSLKGAPVSTPALTEAVTQPPAAPPTEAVTLPPTEVVTQPPTEPPAALGSLTLTSGAFANDGDIPMRYGQAAFNVKIEGNISFVCENSPESANVSPALSWANIPREANSLVLLMWDQMNFAFPDAPVDARFPHWLVYNIPSSSMGLSEGVPIDQPVLADGSMQGLNGYPRPYHTGYGGPCPGPNEKHLYIFELYALDTVLDLQADATSDAGDEWNAVQAAMEGHILAQAELKGHYLYQK